MNISKPLILASLAIAGALSTGLAQARSDINWSIGISAPIDHGLTLGTVISNGPRYQSAPSYYAPAPIYYQPSPIYYQPSPIYYNTRPVYVQPRQIYVAPRWHPRAHAREHWRHGRHDRRYDRGHDRHDRHDRHDDRRYGR
jgi:hypothetical protein